MGSRNLDDGSELQLPDDIISDIVSRFLASPSVTSKEAIQLGLLSKAIFHQVQNRPNLIFDGSKLEENRYNEELNYMNAVLHRYDEDNIHLETFTFKILRRYYDNIHVSYDPESIEDECIDLATKRSLKTLNLCIRYGTKPLPESVYGVESLVQLSLRKWDLHPERRIAWPNLKRLCLDSVDMKPIVFEDVLRSCPLIENLEILECHVFKYQTFGVVRSYLYDFKFRVPNLRNLKKVTFRPWSKCQTFGVSSAPNLESIACRDLTRSFITPGQLEYQNLRTLSLDYCVGMDTDLLFDNFAREFPKLEEFYVGNDSTLHRIHLSSPSLKKIQLVNMGSLKQACFDVPNIVLFEFKCNYGKLIGNLKILPKLSFIGNPKFKQELEKFTTQYLNGSEVSLRLL